MKNRVIKVKLIKTVSNPFQGGTASFEMFEFMGDGSRNSFAISFTCHKSLAGCLDNNAEISIYNVKPEAYGEIYAHYSQYKVELYIGYSTGELTKLISGYLLRVWNTREGLDDKIALIVHQYADRAIAEGSKELSSQNIEVAWTQYEYLSGLGGAVVAPQIGAQELLKTQTLQQVIYLLAKKFQGLPGNGKLKIEMSNIALPKIEGAFKTRTLSGTFYGIMDTLAHEYKFTWTIQDDVLYVFKDEDVAKASSSAPVRKIGADTLMSCEPLLQGQFFMNQIGMKITAILDPACKPGKVVELESKIYPKFNGKYFIHEVDYSGSTIASEWKMELESKMTRIG